MENKTPIDNFEKIKPLLKFDNEHEFYFLQIIQRKKDHKQGHILGTSNNSRLIRAYYIYSIEQLERYRPEIISLCDLFGARAGIALNRRNAKKLSLEMLSLLAQNIKSNHFSQLGSLYNTICGQYFESTDKTWILDVDGFVGFTTVDLERFLEQQEPKGEKIITYIKSKQGYHAICKPFDPRNFKESEIYKGVEIHKNNPTNLYIP